MWQFLARVHWDEFFKSKAVLSGIGILISGAVSITGHSIDPQQLDHTVTIVTQIAQGLVELFAALAVVFRTTATTALMAPPAILPVVGSELPVTKAAAKATLQTLTAGDVVTPAQEAAVLRVIAQPLAIPEKTS